MAERVAPLIERCIRDRIWKNTLKNAVQINDKKVESEIRTILELFGTIEKTEEIDEVLLSKFLWNIENEISLVFRAARAAEQILHSLIMVKNETRLLGYYLAAWTRIYGRYALVQGIKESIEKIKLDIDKLRYFSADLLLLTYLCSQDKEYAKREIIRLCSLTETPGQCKRVLEAFDLADGSTLCNQIGVKVDSLRKTKEFVLGVFFTLENTTMYVIHERVVDPLLSRIEGLLPHNLDSPTKILDFLSTGGSDEIREKVMYYKNIYLGVLP